MKYVMLTWTVVFGAVMFVPCLYAADLIERLNDSVQDWGYNMATSIGRKNGGTA